MDFSVTLSHWTLFIVVALVILVFCKPKRNLPPGPNGLPVLGNLLQLPKTEQFRRLTEWKEEFGTIESDSNGIQHLSAFPGPIYSLNLAGQTVVVLNTFKVAADLLGMVCIHF
jgi:hypothetical protein